MTNEEAIKWMEEAILDTNDCFDQCSPALQKELIEQKEVFELAVSALRKISEGKGNNVPGTDHFREATKMMPVERLRELVEADRAGR